MANNREQAYRNYRSYLRGRKIVVAVAAMVLVLAMTAVAYAATGGQLFQMVRVLINGQERDASAYMNSDGSLTVDLEPGDRVEIQTEDVTFSTDGQAAREGENLSVTILPVQTGVDEQGPYANVAGQRMDLVEGQAEVIGEAGAASAPAKSANVG